jgi:hypothetical protein
MNIYLLLPDKTNGLDFTTLIARPCGSRDNYYWEIFEYLGGDEPEIVSDRILDWTYVSRRNNLTVLYGVG